MNLKRIRITALLLAVLTILAILPVGVAAEEVACFELVTALSELSDGDTVLLVAEQDGVLYALGKRSAYWRESASVAEKDGKLYGDTATVSTDTLPYSLTVGLEKGALSFYDSINGGYLYSSSASYSRLQSSATLTDAGRFVPSFADGKVSLLALDSTVRNALGFNSVNERFTCFDASAEYVKLSIYKYIGKAEKPADSSVEELYACTPTDMYASYHSNEELLETRINYTGVLLENVTYMLSLTDARGVGISTRNVLGSELKGINCLFYSFNITDKALSEYSSPFKLSLSSKTANAIKTISAAVTESDEAPVYYVYFSTPFGESWSAQKVKRGEDAVPPTPAEQSKYSFVGWDGDYTSITEDISLTALYTEKSFTVVFLDKDGEELKSETVKYGESATPPEAPVIEGYSFDGWTGGTYTNVSSQQTLYASYSKLRYTVSFIATEGGTLSYSAVTVDYGTPTSLLIFPATYPDDGYEFVAWEYGSNTVIGDMTVTAVFKKLPQAGDINGDGVVNAADATLALQHDVALITLIDSDFDSADVTDDGAVNSLDAYFILLYDAKLISRFPCEA